MNPFKDQTKKKSLLVGYKSMKYGSQGVKEKHKKQLSIEKQNSKYRDLDANEKTSQVPQCVSNLSKKPHKLSYVQNEEPKKNQSHHLMNNQYSSSMVNEGQSYHQICSKQQNYKNQTQGTINVQQNTVNNHNLNNATRNLTFGTVRTQHQKTYSAVGIQGGVDHNYNHMQPSSQTGQGAQQQNQDFLGNKRKHNKYDIKPLALLRPQHQQSGQPPQHIQEQSMPQMLQRQPIQQPLMSNLNAQLNQMATTKKMTSVLLMNTEEEKRERKNKLKMQLQHHQSSVYSPAVEKEFMCEEEIDLTQPEPIDRRVPLGNNNGHGVLPLDRKISEKRLNAQKEQQPASNKSHNNTNTLVLKHNKKPSLSGNGINPPSSNAQNLQLLKEFNQKESTFDSAFASESLNTVLRIQQQNYSVDPMYLEKNQKAITWIVRAILIDWMRQLSYEYSLKRDTYHLAVVLLDKFLEKKPNVQKPQAQVIGATTLFIASKIEELECRPSEEFAEATKGICSSKDIRSWEIQICKTLEFNLNPPTICSLANRIMQQWDTYLDEVEYAQYHECFHGDSEGEGSRKVYFKKADQASFKLFRMLMQFLDCATLDIQTSQYRPLMMVLSFMYLLVGQKVAGFSSEEIHKVFPRKSHYLIDQSDPFNDLFEDFVRQSFGMSLVELLPAVQYSATYFNLTIAYDKPRIEEEEMELMSMEEYGSFQTYNRHMLKTVNTRERGILNAF